MLGIAAAFVDAGVPHVIAVKLDAKVSDTAAHIFVCFYLLLCSLSFER
jgi:hypothetical protein